MATNIKFYVDDVSPTEVILDFTKDSDYLTFVETFGVTVKNEMGIKIQDYDFKKPRKDAFITLDIDALKQNYDIIPLNYSYIIGYFLRKKQ